MKKPKKKALKLVKLRRSKVVSPPQKVRPDLRKKELKNACRMRVEIGAESGK